MKKKLTFAEILIGLLGFLTAVCLSVSITLNFRPLYYMDIGLWNLEEESGYSEKVIRANYDILIDYNNVWNTGQLEFQGMGMSETARIHFREVKRIFCGMEIFAAAGSVCMIFLAMREKRKKRCGWLKAGGICCIAIPGLLGVFVAADWMNVFLTFHRLVFQNDYWLFDPATDPIITILPDGYFMQCAVMIVGLLFACAAALLLRYRSLSKRKIFLISENQK